MIEYISVRCEHRSAFNSHMQSRGSNSQTLNVKSEFHDSAGPSNHGSYMVDSFHLSLLGAPLAASGSLPAIYEAPEALDRLLRNISELRSYSAAPFEPQSLTCPAVEIQARTDTLRMISVGSSCFGSPSGSSPVEIPEV